MSKITNITGISLPLAVWLAADDYDFVPGAKSISATSLLKPVRQILLKERLTKHTRETPDASDFIASRLGHSIHDGIERAWTEHYRTAMLALGFSPAVIERVVINPETVFDGQIPVYLEHRGERVHRGYTISGKFDMVLDGELKDFKSTSVYSWLLGSKDEDYRLQGSIYRWIHHDKITSDHIDIQFIFTDWSRAQAKQNPDYPQQRVKEHRVELMSLEETQAWIDQRLDNLERYADADEADIPHCSEKDLWRSPTRYKYYSDPKKAEDPNARSSKNFDNLTDANRHCAEKGKGVVVTVPGQVKACAYCPAFTICTQKDLYEHA